MDRGRSCAGMPVLGICYGQQLITHLLGGEVRKGDKGEFGLAFLDLQTRRFAPASTALTDHQQIWMSHRDLVAAPPAGFRVLATTSTCADGGHRRRVPRLYGVQFHPEVVHTTRRHAHSRKLRLRYLRLREGLESGEPRSRWSKSRFAQRAGDRNVFFFVSGGVDSTVAFTLCLRGARFRARVRRLCRYRSDARRRDRIRRGHVRRARRTAS